MIEAARRYPKQEFNDLKTTNIPADVIFMDKNMQVGNVEKLFKFDRNTMLAQREGGFFDKILEWGKKLNYITMAAEGAILAAGVALKSSALVRLATGAILLDIGGLVLINYIENQRKGQKGLRRDALLNNQNTQPVMLRQNTDQYLPLAA